MNYCNSCGAQQLVRSKYCTNCGTALSKPDDLTKGRISRKQQWFFYGSLSIAAVISALLIFLTRSGSEGAVSANPGDPDRAGVQNTMTGDGKFVYKEDCFVIITGSYESETNAINAVKTMREQGSLNSGYFWRPDFPSVADKSLFSTFIGPFKTYQECQSALREYKLQSDTCTGLIFQ